MVVEIFFSLLNLNLGQGWDTGLGRSGGRASEETVLHQGENLDDERGQEDEEGEVEEGGGGLCLLTSGLGALSNVVFVKVCLVRTGVGSGTDSERGGGGEGEDEVQEVEDHKEEWGAEEPDEEGGQTVEGGCEQTPSCGEHSKIDT